MAPYSDDKAWMWAFEEIVPPLHGAFRPDITLVQCGADAYHADPLAHLLLTENVYVRVAERLRSISGGAWWQSVEADTTLKRHPGSGPRCLQRLPDFRSTAIGCTDRSLHLASMLEHRHASWTRQREW